MGETNELKWFGVRAAHAGKIDDIGQVTVTTTATQIAVADTSRHSLIIINHSSTVSIYLSYANTVTATTGILLGPLQSITIEGMDDAVWGITAAGSAVVSWWDLVESI